MHVRSEYLDRRLCRPYKFLPILVIHLLLLKTIRPFQDLLVSHDPVLSQLYIAGNLIDTHLLAWK